MTHLGLEYPEEKPEGREGQKVPENVAYKGGKQNPALHKTPQKKQYCLKGDKVHVHLKVFGPARGGDGENRGETPAVKGVKKSEKEQYEQIFKIKPPQGDPHTHPPGFRR